ncbi:MAG TPA: hypothetical protein VKT71_12245 [Candidatus Acidoferrales bacterium]|nr:hypothetical protein [Candidatus Acidoferrales bacterium]
MMNRKKRLRAVAGTASGCLLLALAGCQSAPPVAPVDAKPAAETAKVVDDARAAAEASLGKQAEILTRGNLAQNGLEQVLVVNRASGDSGNAKAAPAAANSPAILVTRAAVLQRDGGKWSQVLLCDEHLKNPYGYLGGSHAAHAAGWRLQYRQEPAHGLEMKFTPAGRAGDVNAGQDSETSDAAFDVRWNKNAKRYQSYDQSHERYLSEIPSLETPQSILK